MWLRVTLACSSHQAQCVCMSIFCIAQTSEPCVLCTGLASKQQMKKVVSEIEKAAKKDSSIAGEGVIGLFYCLCPVLTLTVPPANDVQTRTMTI